MWSVLAGPMESSLNCCRNYRKIWSIDWRGNRKHCRLAISKRWKIQILCHPERSECFAKAKRSRSRRTCCLPPGIGDARCSHRAPRGPLERTPRIVRAQPTAPRSFDYAAHALRARAAALRMTEFVRLTCYFRALVTARPISILFLRRHFAPSRGRLGPANDE